MKCRGCQVSDKVYGMCFIAINPVSRILMKLSDFSMIMNPCPSNYDAPLALYTASAQIQECVTTITRAVQARRYAVLLHRNFGGERRTFCSDEVPLARHKPTVLDGVFRKDKVI